MTSALEPIPPRTSPAQQRRDERLIAALLAQPTHRSAAKAAGVSERTLRRRLEDPAFRARVAEASRRTMIDALAGLSRATSIAVTALTAIAAGAVKADVARVAAAKALLEASLHVLERGLGDAPAAPGPSAPNPLDALIRSMVERESSAAGEATTPEYVPPSKELA